MQRKVQFLNHVTALQNINIDFSGLILGMSHSYLGTFTNLFSEPVYKLSWNSADLHFMYRTIQQVLNDSYVDRQKLKVVLIEMPYYIFNYDYSLNGLNYQKGLTFWDTWNDYHHLLESRGIELEHYRLYLEMFGESEKCNSTFCYTDDISNIGTIGGAELDNLKRKLPHVWRENHDKTIEENIVFFRAIIAMVLAYSRKIKIIICVFPQSRYFEDLYSDKVSEKKELFYSLVETYIRNDGVEVWDDFSLYYGQDKLFRDPTHLNKYGASLYTKILDDRLSSEIADWGKK